MTDRPNTSDLLPDLLPTPVRLPADERALFDRLPIYGDDQRVTEVAYEEEAACRRLAKRGLVKVHRWKDDPISIRPTMYAGRLADA